MLINHPVFMALPLAGFFVLAVFACLGQMAAGSKGPPLIFAILAAVLSAASLATYLYAWNASSETILLARDISGIDNSSTRSPQVPKNNDTPQPQPGPPVAYAPGGGGILGSDIGARVTPAGLNSRPKAIVLTTDGAQILLLEPPSDWQSSGQFASAEEYLWFGPNKISAQLEAYEVRANNMSLPQIVASLAVFFAAILAGMSSILVSVEGYPQFAILQRSRSWRLAQTVHRAALRGPVTGLRSTTAPLEEEHSDLCNPEQKGREPNDNDASDEQRFQRKFKLWNDRLADHIRARVKEHKKNHPEMFETEQQT